MNTVTEVPDVSEVSITCPLCLEPISVTIKVKWTHLDYKTFIESAQVPVSCHECYPAPPSKKG